MANQTNRRQSKNQQAAIARRAARKRAERKRNLIAIAVIAAVLAIIGGLFIGAGEDPNQQATSTSTSTTTTAASPVPTVAPVPPGRTISGATPCPGENEERVSRFAQAPPVCIDPNQDYTATFDMNVGRVVVDLMPERSPIAVNNFVVLSRYDFYSGSAIFRTDPSIDIIQGGSPNTQTNQDSPGYQIQDDAGSFTYTEGELIMARGGAPNSAGSQYFFSTGPNVANLNSQGTYVTIGKVTEGLDVLKRIIASHVDTGGRLGGAPGMAVVVNDITIAQK